MGWLVAAVAVLTLLDLATDPNGPWKRRNVHV